MRTRTKIKIVAALLALVAAGCQGPQTTAPAVVTRDHTISVGTGPATGPERRGSRRRFVVLRGGGNTVLIFTQRRRFFVNGKPIGLSEGA